MKVAVYLLSNKKITGTVEIEDDQFKNLGNGWIKVPAQDWLRFQKGKMRIKKGAYLSFEEFKKLSYKGITFPDCGCIDFETTKDIEIKFDDLKFQFWLEDKKEHQYHGEIEVSQKTIICLSIMDYEDKFTPNGYAPKLDEQDFFCFSFNS